MFSQSEDLCADVPPLRPFVQDRNISGESDLRCAYLSSASLSLTHLAADDIVKVNSGEQDGHPRFTNQRFECTDWILEHSCANIASSCSLCPPKGRRFGRMTDPLADNIGPALSVFKYLKKRASTQRQCTTEPARRWRGGRMMSL